MVRLLRLRLVFRLVVVIVVIVAILTAAAAIAAAVRALVRRQRGPVAAPEETEAAAEEATAT